MRFAMVPRAFLRYATFLKLRHNKNRNYLKHSSKDIRESPSAFEVARGLLRFIPARTYKNTAALTKEYPAALFGSTRIY